MVNYLICVDGSEYAKAAFFSGISMIDKTKDHLWLITVVEDLSQYYGNWMFGPVYIPSDIHKKAKEHARALLHKYIKICHQLGIPCTGLISISSHVGEAICQAVDAKKIDVLIMARRGLGKVKRFFVGSTTKYCVEHANCNVLVLKGDWKPAEDHGPELKEIVLAEEKERERRMHEPLESTLKHKKQELEAELLQKIESFHVTGVQPAEVSST